MWISSLMVLLASCFFFTASSSTRGLMVIPCRQDKNRERRLFRGTKIRRDDDSASCRSVIKNSSSIIKIVPVRGGSEKESISSVESHSSVKMFPLLHSRWDEPAGCHASQCLTTADKVPLPCRLNISLRKIILEAKWEQRIWELNKNKNKSSNNLCFHYLSDKTVN